MTLSNLPISDRSPEFRAMLRVPPDQLVDRVTAAIGVINIVFALVRSNSLCSCILSFRRLDIDKFLQLEAHFKICQHFRCGKVGKNALLQWSPALRARLWSPKLHRKVCLLESTEARRPRKAAIGPRSFRGWSALRWPP